MAEADIQNMPVRSITYSERYSDDVYEYRHVILPPAMVTLVPKTHLMTETEWRNLGIQQSTGWQHFMLYPPEPYVLLFRRPKPPPTETPQSGTDNNTESSSNQQETNESEEQEVSDSNAV